MGQDLAKQYAIHRARWDEKYEEFLRRHEEKKKYRKPKRDRFRKNTQKDP